MKTLITLIAAGLLAAAAPSRAQDDPLDGFVYDGSVLEQSLQEAGELIDRERYDEAARLLEDVIDVDSTVAYAYFLRGVAAYYQDSTADAATWFRRATERDSADPSAWLWMGYSMLRLEEYDLAEWCSLEALEIDPANANARNLLGRALYRQRRYSEAAGEHLAASLMEPDNRLFHEEYAWASYFGGSYEEAFEGFRRALAAEDSLPRLWDGRSWAALKLGRWDEAAEAAERELAFAGDTVSALTKLALVERESEGAAGAGGGSRLAEAADGRASALAEISRGYLMLRREVAALEAALEAVRLEPRNTRALIALGVAWGRNDSVARVCETYASLAVIDFEEARQLDNALGDWPPLGGFCADAREDYAFARGLFALHDDSTYLHRETGLRFPPSIAGAVREGWTVYPDPRAGMSMKYRKRCEDGESALEADVFIYPAPPGAAGPTFHLDETGGRIMDTAPAEQGKPRVFLLDDPSPAFTAEYERAKYDIVQRPQNAELIMEFRRTVSQSGRGEIGLAAAYSIPGGEGRNVSKLYLFARPDYFIKIRTTFPESSSTDEPAAIRNFIDDSDFVDGLGWERKYRGTR